MPQYPRYSLFDVEEDREGNVKPVTQTIKTDPVTGQQTMTISGSPQDLSAANPFTPTVAMPGDEFKVAGPVPPGAMGGMTENQAQRAARLARAATVVAGPVAGAAAGAAMKSVMPTTSPQGASAVTKTAQTFGSAAADPNMWMSDIIKLQNDPNALAAYYGNQSNSEPGRNLARDLLRQGFESQKKQQEAQQKVDTAMKTGNMLDVAREAQKSGEEGSYIKAYFYSRLGLNDLAQKEQEKISPTVRWERVMTNDNKPALVKVGKNGLPLEGYTAEGKMDDKQLVSIGGTAQGLDIVGGTYVNDKTGQVGRVVTDKRTGVSFIQTDTGRVGMAGFRPQSTAGGLSDMAARQYQDARIKFESQPSIETATEYLKFARTVDNGDGSMIREAQAQISRLPFGRQILSGGAGVPAAQPGAQPAPVVPAQPAAEQPGPVTPEMVPQAAPQMPAQPAAAQPAAVAPVRPAQSQAAAAAAQRPAAVTGAPVVGAGPVVPSVTPQIAAPSTQIRPGESPAIYQERVKREAAAYESALRQAEAQQRANLDVGVAQQRAGIEVGQQQQIRSQQSVETNRTKAGELEQNARIVIDTIDQMVKHPGFNDVIGVPSITSVLNLPGDARNFKALYDQLNGQTFVTAYKELKGGGSITEAEGIKAEQAIAALRDPRITEKEWKRNAQTLIDVTKRGVDVARIRGNLEPKYKPFNDKEREAFNFILANPNDPRVPRIRNILENR